MGFFFFFWMPSCTLCHTHYLILHWFAAPIKFFSAQKRTLWELMIYVYSDCYSIIASFVNISAVFNKNAFFICCVLIVFLNYNVILTVCVNFFFHTMYWNLYWWTPSKFNGKIFELIYSENILKEKKNSLLKNEMFVKGFINY